MQFSNKNCIVIYFFDCATTWCRLTDFFFENIKSDLTFNFFKPNLIVRCSIIYLSWAFSFIYQLVKSISQLHHAYHTIDCNFSREVQVGKSSLYQKKVRTSSNSLLPRPFTKFFAIYCMSTVAGIFIQFLTKTIYLVSTLEIWV